MSTKNFYQYLSSSSSQIIVKWGYPLDKIEIIPYTNNISIEFIPNNPILISGITVPQGGRIFNNCSCVGVIVSRDSGATDVDIWAE